jgi:hypothetical protein
MKDLSFWAQSLDNQSPDIIFSDGKELSDDESRQNLVSEIYEIPKNNLKTLPASSGVTIRYFYPKFVIEVIPTERDQVHRLAPVIIYGILPENCSGTWIGEVCNEIEEFILKRLQRTLDQGVLTAIQDSLNEAIKKKIDLRSNLLSIITHLLFGLASWLKPFVNKLFKSY